MSQNVQLSADSRAHAPMLGLREVFSVVGGPAAWFTQLCVGNWLANEPCFAGPERLTVPLRALAWTWPALLVLLCGCALIALGAFFVSMRIYREIEGAAAGTPVRAAGRIRFMAFWGMVFGAGFCVATLLTAAAFATLPRCAG